MKAFLVLSLLAGSVAMASLPVSPVDLKAVTKANNEFAFNLANALKVGESGKNELISPSSVGMDFTMLLNGTTGKTGKELARALSVSGMDLGQVNAANRAMITGAQSDEGAKMVFANAIFSRDVELVPAYVTDMAHSYNAEIGTLPATSSAALAKVNGWVNKHTKERIKKILERLDAADVMVLLNAVTFDGEWQTEFNPIRTTKQPFHGPGGKTLADMMFQEAKRALYAEVDGMQCVRLGYKGGNYGMTLMLPKQGRPVSSVLNAGVFAKMSGALRPASGQVRIPKFKFDSDYNLVPAFKDLGARRLFSASNDYGNMVKGGGPLFVCQAVHKAFIEVDEKGTKAAAATAIVMHRGAPEPGFRFTADRPFAFFITDSRTGTILFMGVVNQP